MLKRGKNASVLGAFHSNDISEFYGTGPTPDFIGTDALGKLLFPLINTPHRSLVC